MTKRAAFLFQTQTGHYLLLLAVTAALTLPNLGAHSLWDIDEGLNAEAAREMLVRGNWITPSMANCAPPSRHCYTGSRWSRTWHSA
jgi:4-amino-4-deoxy-L-arabinose transferase-like glycosyltransferase